MWREGELLTWTVDAFADHRHGAREVNDDGVAIRLCDVPIMLQCLTGPFVRLLGRVLGHVGDLLPRVILDSCHGGTSPSIHWCKPISLAVLASKWLRGKTRGVTVELAKVGQAPVKMKSGRAKVGRAPVKIKSGRAEVVRALVR